MLSLYTVYIYLVYNYDCTHFMLFKYVIVTIYIYTLSIDNKRNHHETDRYQQQIEYNRIKLTIGRNLERPYRIYYTYLVKKG